MKRYASSEFDSAPNNAFLYMELKAGSEVYRNDHFFTQPKKCALSCTEVDITSVKVNGKDFEVKIRSSCPAFWVTVNAEDIRGAFNDNGFTLLPARPEPSPFRQTIQRASRRLSADFRFAIFATPTPKQECPRTFAFAKGARAFAVTINGNPNL